MIFESFWCELIAIFFAASQYVNWFDCFPGMIDNMPPSELNKFCSLTIAESRANVWPVKVI